MSDQKSRLLETKILNKTKNPDFFRLFKTFQAIKNPVINLLATLALINQEKMTLSELFGKSKFKIRNKKHKSIAITYKNSKKILLKNYER